MTKNQEKTGEKTPAPLSAEPASLDFDALVAALVTVDAQIRAQTSKAVNMGLTARNWLYGLYIFVYEQNGSDRAAYGEQLVDKLSERLRAAGRVFEPRTPRAAAAFNYRKWMRAVVERLLFVLFTFCPMTACKKETLPATAL